MCLALAARWLLQRHTLQILSPMRGWRGEAAQAREGDRSSACMCQTSCVASGRSQGQAAYGIARDASGVTSLHRHPLVTQEQSEASHDGIRLGGVDVRSSSTCQQCSSVQCRPIQRHGSHTLDEQWEFAECITELFTSWRLAKCQQATEQTLMGFPRSSRSSALTYGMLGLEQVLRTFWCASLWRHAEAGCIRRMFCVSFRAIGVGALFCASPASSTGR